ncbi:uncharacterized protein LOC120090546 [Benincasa hispida]|uniref:uncharacterized protein LOC120090546 n=1 Tax=Benincasa hispida TaxID=102211 RepID=UPI0019002727|nr:uncharacterized protein LOC120090546 [Benincasa hispida]
MSIPRYAGFKNQSEGKYLQYLPEGHLKGNLQYSSNIVVSLLTKFALEPAKKSRYWHIRCCYNNKYLASSNDHNRLVTPSVSKPTEDESSHPCTLFNIVPGPTPGTYYLVDVLLQTYVCRCTTSKIHQNCLTTRYDVIEKHSDKLHMFTDFENFIVLPKHVAFKGDNGLFLAAFWYNDWPYLQFNSDDIGSPWVGNEVFNVGDGTIRIKNDYFNKFWIRNPNWILADTDDTTANDKNTLFWPVKISKNKVALRSLGNDMYCRRYTADGKVDCLNSRVPSIIKEAEFEIVEPIISREIYNCKYRTMDARVYDETIVTMAIEEAVNGSTKEATMALSFKYTEERTKSWESVLSMSMNVKTSVTAGIPEIAQAGIEINLHFDASYTWGETISETKEVTETYTVTVPEKTRMKVTLLATKAKTDVPFSYTRRDVLRNGKRVTTECDDGLFVGANTYKVVYENKALPL